jgi:glycosyltransferase involved in cell wall biosynthesis
MVLQEHRKLSALNGEPSLSVVIPAYNEEEELPSTLRALHRAFEEDGIAGAEVIVVDNNSSDRTAEVARAHGARTVFEPVNQIARARNAGAREARSPFLVFVDADTRIPPGLLTQVVEGLGKNLGGGGARIEFDTALPPSMTRLHRYWDWLSQRNSWAAGSFLFARRPLFERAGGFCEKVYAGEEIVLSRALRRHARREGLDFCILKSPAVLTSARKFHWYGPAQTLLYVSFLSLFPLALRSRRLCAYWYRRPV